MKEYIRYGVKNEDGTVNWGDWTEDSGGGGLSGTVGNDTTPVWLDDGELKAVTMKTNGNGTKIPVSLIPFLNIGDETVEAADDYSTAYLNVGWYYTNYDGALLALRNKNYSSPGAFELFARANSTSYTLLGEINGTLTWSGSSVKLGTSTVGSATNPVYLNSGKLAACNDYGIVSGYSKSSNGYIKFSNGIILQWGSGSTGGAQYVDTTFPTSFSSTNYVVVVTDRDNSISTSWSHNSICIATSYSSASKFRAVADYDMEAFWYVAVGY